MGLLDVLRGKRELKRPAPDRLFALTTAYVTLKTGLGIHTRGVTDMEEVVRATSSDAAGKLETSDDSFGYRWMILRDPDFEDLVVGVNAFSSALEAGGYGERILCAVFPFEEAGGARRYWIYNYK